MYWGRKIRFGYSEGSISVILRLQKKSVYQDLELLQFIHSNRDLYKKKTSKSNIFSLLFKFICHLGYYNISKLGDWSQPVKILVNGQLATYLTRRKYSFPVVGGMLRSKSSLSSMCTASAWGCNSSSTRLSSLSIFTIVFST